MAKRADIAIVGGGIIGCAIAWELARAGASHIVVFERGEIGGEASGAAAGVLAIASSRAPRGALFDLRRASAAAFPSFLERLAEDTNIDSEYRHEGLVELAFEPAEAERLARLVERRREQGFQPEVLSAAGVRQIEPGVSDAVVGGAYFPEDHTVNNVRLVAALCEAAARRGVTFRTNAEVKTIEKAGARVTSIRADSEQWDVGRLIIATGAWSGAVGKLIGKKIPVRPDRGEMASVQPSVRIQHTLAWGDGYLVPRKNGELLIGSTSARNVWEKEVTARSLALLLGRATRMVPALSDSPLLRTWAGLRPCPTIRRPIIGSLPGYENVVLATGHHRSGILLAPITARLVAELVVHGATSISLVPFAYRPR